MDDEEFFKFLYSPSLIDAYKEEKRQQFHQLEQEFNSKKDFLEKAKKNAIEIDRKHRGVINVCVTPFTEKGSLRNLGYQFIRASPLSELRIPNVDFLLYKQTHRTKIAIFGEAKGSISTSNPDKIINEFKTRISKIEQNTDYIKTNYLKIPINETVYFEYVIAVPSGDVPSILKKAIEKGGGIIIWHTPITGLDNISVAFPPKIIPPTIESSMMHRDHELNKAMNHALSNRKMFNFFPQSHPVSKLQSIFFAARIGETSLIVSEDELRENLSKELFYVDDSVIAKEAKSILSLGLKIDFLETILGTNQYRIKAKSYRADRLEQTVEVKWIKYQLDEELKEKKELAIQEIQSKYSAEKRKDRKLGDFGIRVG